MFEIELGEGSASLQATGARDGGRRGRGRHARTSRSTSREARPVVLESGSARHRGGRPRSATSATARASGDMTLRAVSGRIAIEAVSGDVDIMRHRRGDVDDPDRVGRRRAARRRPCARSTRRRPAATSRSPAGSPVPDRSAIVTVSGDAQLAPAGDVRIEMATLSRRPALGGRRPDRGRPWAPVAGRRCRRAAGHFRSMSGDLTSSGRRRSRRPGRSRRAGPAEPPEPPEPPRRRRPSRPSAARNAASTAPSRPPTTTRGCGSCARSSAARSTSPRPAAGSRRSTAASRSRRRIRRRTTRPGPRRTSDASTSTGPPRRTRDDA